MKLYVAGMVHETNSFSPIPTSLRSFEQSGLYLPSRMAAAQRAPIEAQLEQSVGYGDFLRLARERGFEVVRGPAAWAQPSGPLVRRDYELIRDEILNELRAALPVDAVLLMLHGAQMADGYEDCEGDLLERMRAIVGPDVPVGAELDLHANISEKMLRNALLVACKEYPHTDFRERAVELFDIVIRAARKEIRPLTQWLRVPMLGGFHTPSGPGRKLIDYAMSLEGRDGVLSTSLLHGFGLADTPDTTALAIVITDDAPARGEIVLRELGARMYALRGRVRSSELTVDDAVERALEAPRGPVIIAEPDDNPGGGWASDNTAIARALIERNAERAAVALIWDPQAVELATAAGVGAKLPMRIGGKVGPQSGQPLDLDVEVVAINPDARQHSLFSNGRTLFGPAAAVRTGGVTIVLSSVRTQPFSPEVFTELGIEPTEQKVLALKSSQHFYARFSPLVADVLYCNGRMRGATGSMRTYRRIRRPIWPLDEPDFDARTAEIHSGAHA